MKKVYHTHIHNPIPGLRLLEEPLVRYFREKKRRFNGLEVDNYFACPAHKELFKNTYIVKSDVDVHLQTNNGTLSCLDKSQEWFDEFIGYANLSENNEYEIAQFNFSNHLFFSQESVTITMTPAFNHSELLGVYGTYDVSKWFRRVRPAILIPQNSEVKISKGDPLFYLTFSEPVELIPFEHNDELGSLERDCLTLKTVYGKGYPTPLRKIYSWFTEKKMNARIMRIINEQQQ